MFLQEVTLGLLHWTSFLLHSSNNLTFITPFRSQLLCISPLMSFFNDVLDRILFAVNGTDAPTLLSVSFSIQQSEHSTCCRWIFYSKCSSTAPVCFTSKWHLFTSWSDGKTVHSLLYTVARSLVFDLSSLTTRLLAGECSSTCALSLSSFLVWFPPEDTPLHRFQRFNIKVESPF